MTPRSACNARPMTKLAHPNVVRIFEVGLADGKGIAAMEDGGTLAAWHRERGPPGERAGVHARLARMSQAGEGLAAAHAAGIVHRGFKSENNLLDSEGVHVAGFNRRQ